MREPENIGQVLTLKPDYMGFIFYPKSPRFVQNVQPLQQWKAATKKVGVFVNATRNDILETVQQAKLDAVQLHGDESLATANAIKPHVTELFKVFRVGESFNRKLVEPWLEVATHFLFDAAGKNYGGNGTRFNWQTLENWNPGLPWWLSGGLGPDALQQVQQYNFINLYGLDVNSSFETSPAVKDVEKLKEFSIQLKKI